MSRKPDNDFDAIHRRKRTRPTSTGKRVTSQERDLLWFQKIREHGPLSTSFLHAFSRHLRVSEKRAKERLTDLFNEDNTPHGGPYLARPHQQFRTIDSRYNELVYELTPASIAALKDNNSWNENSGAHAGPWLHRYMVSLVTASIELAATGKDDLTYVPQSAILGRAESELRYPTTFTEPETGQDVTKLLIPDAVFGLEYRKGVASSYRFFVVEADRGTEPTTTKNFNRKSHLRNLLQYRDYIGNGRYKEHLRLSAPLLVLNVSTDQAKHERMIKLTGEVSGPAGNSYMLYQCFDGIGPTFRPSPLQSCFLDQAWSRAAQERIYIGHR